MNPPKAPQDSLPLPGVPEGLRGVAVSRGGLRPGGPGGPGGAHSEDGGNSPFLEAVVATGGGEIGVQGGPQNLGGIPRGSFNPRVFRGQPPNVLGAPQAPGKILGHLKIPEGIPEIPGGCPWPARGNGEGALGGPSGHSGTPRALGCPQPLTRHLWGQRSIPGVSPILHRGGLWGVGVPEVSPVPWGGSLACP